MPRCRYYTRKDDPIGPGHRCELPPHGPDEDHVVRVGAATHTRAAGKGRRVDRVEATAPIQLRVSARAREIYEAPGTPQATRAAARSAARRAFEGVLTGAQPITHIA